MPNQTVYTVDVSLTELIVIYIIKLFQTRLIIKRADEKLKQHPIILEDKPGPPRPCCWELLDQ